MAEFILFTSSSESRVANSRTILWRKGKKNTFFGRESSRQIPHHWSSSKCIFSVLSCRAAAKASFAVTIWELPVQNCGNHRTILHYDIFSDFSVVKSTFTPQRNKRKWAVTVKVAPTGDVQVKGLDRRANTVNPTCVINLYSVLKWSKLLQQPAANASNLYVIRDVFGEGHVKHNQGLPRHGRMGEGVTAPVWSHSALQVGPVPHRVHRLIPGTLQVHN